MHILCFNKSELESVQISITLCKIVMTCNVGRFQLTKYIVYSKLFTIVTGKLKEYFLLKCCININLISRIVRFTSL